MYKSTGLTHVCRALGHALRGLHATIIGEAAFRHELLLGVILFPLSWWLGETGVERALLMGSLLLVLIVEILNSAIETTVDRISTEHHPLSGRAKDMGAAAVLLSIVNAFMVWIMVVLY